MNNFKSINQNFVKIVMTFIVNPVQSPRHISNMKKNKK